MAAHNAPEKPVTGSGHLSPTRTEPMNMAPPPKRSGMTPASPQSRPRVGRGPSKRLDIEFERFAPASFPFDIVAGVISPRDEERIRLAAELHNAGSS